MGGGDLNLKKHWHPGTYKNQEIVWKKEQEELAEKKKLALLKKEKEEERNREEMERLTGKAKRTIQMEWMYAQGPMASTQAVIDEEKEAYLLGKKRLDDAVKDQQIDSIGQQSKTFVYGLSANTSRDIQNKVREDPLFSFKKQEQASLEALMNNPIRLKQLQKKLEEKRKKKSKKHEKERELDQDSFEKKRNASPIRDRSPNNRRQISPLERSPLQRYRERERSRSPEYSIRRRSKSPQYRRSRSKERSYRNRSRSPQYRRSRSRDGGYRNRSRSPRRQIRNRSKSPDVSSQDMERKLEAMKQNALNLKQKKQDRMEKDRLLESKIEKLEQEKRESNRDFGKSNTFINQIHKSNLESSSISERVQQSGKLYARG